MRRRSELAEALNVTVFAPDDLDLVQGGPAGRREYLDDVLVGRHPRLDALVTEVDRILRQRAAVLRQAGGRPDADIVATLDVWDARLGDVGHGAGRRTRGAGRRAHAPRRPRLRAPGGRGRARDADVPPVVGRATCSTPWRRRGPTTCGARSPRWARIATTSSSPSGPRPARTHASQGEQRCVALALRLATHELRRGDLAEPPVLLLDDVFSELDARRAAALVDAAPPGPGAAHHGGRPAPGGPRRPGGRGRRRRRTGWWPEAP